MANANINHVVGEEYAVRHRGSRSLLAAPAPSAVVLVSHVGLLSLRQTAVRIHSRQSSRALQPGDVDARRWPPLKPGQCDWRGSRWVFMACYRRWPSTVRWLAIHSMDQS